MLQLLCVSSAIRNEHGRNTRARRQGRTNSSCWQVVHAPQPRQ